jgi:hypothetical protein
MYVYQKLFKDSRIILYDEEDVYYFYYLLWAYDVAVLHTVLITRKSETDTRYAYNKYEDRSW